MLPSHVVLRLHGKTNPETTGGSHLANTVSEVDGIETNTRNPQTNSLTQNPRKLIIRKSLYVKRVALPQVRALRMNLV